MKTISAHCNFFNNLRIIKFKLERFLFRQPSSTFLYRYYLEWSRILNSLFSRDNNDVPNVIYQHRYLLKMFCANVQWNNKRCASDSSFTLVLNVVMIFFKSSLSSLSFICEKYPYFPINDKLPKKHLGNVQSTCVSLVWNSPTRNHFQ